VQWSRARTERCCRRACGEEMTCQHQPEEEQP
jgi:hypothetical protein